MVDKLVQEVGSAMCACVCAVASLVVNRYALITVAERSDYWHQYTTNSHISYQACVPQRTKNCRAPALTPNIEYYGITMGAGRVWGIPTNADAHAFNYGAAQAARLRTFMY